MSISNFEYAIFSEFVYNRGSVSLPVGWRVYKTSESQIINFDGYSGEAYINDSTGEVVIAHRGTEPQGIVDLFIADLQLAIDSIPTQFSGDLTEFVTQVKNQMLFEGLNLNKITYTGHSLGGFLAQLSTIQDYYINGNLNTKAVVFESPGVPLDTAQTLLNFSINPSTVSSVRITNFLAAPNLVNTTNQHTFGNDFRLYPNYSSNSIGDAYSQGNYLTNFTLQQHDMKVIVNLFDPLTGEPRIYSDPTSWPSSGYNDYFLSYDNNPHYWNEYFRINNFTETQKTNFINTNLGGNHDLTTTGITIQADDTNNIIFGATNSKDIINANSGNDTIYGFGGDDILNAGTGDDKVDSGSGNDTLTGDQGNDLLIGASGTDSYIFTNLTSNNKDIIKDQDNNGKLFIEGIEVNSIAKLALDSNSNIIENTWIIKHNNKDYYITKVNQFNQRTSEGKNLLITPLTASNSSNNIFIENFNFLNKSFGITIAHNEAEFQVNTYTAGSESYASIDKLSDGGFIVTWSSSDQQGIYAQRFDATGSRVNSELQVSNSVSNLQAAPYVTGLNDGLDVTLFERKNASSIFNIKREQERKRRIPWRKSSLSVSEKSDLAWLSQTQSKKTQNQNLVNFFFSSKKEKKKFTSIGYKALALTNSLNENYANENLKFSEVKRIKHFNLR